MPVFSEYSMNVLLINPAVKGRLPVAFPLSLGYIARVLLDAGHNVKVIDIDGGILKYEQIFEKLKKIDFDLIGITGIVVHYKFLKQLIKDIKEIYPKIPVMVGGGVASPIPKLFLENTKAGIIVIGEGEETVSEVVDSLETKKDLKKVKGIVYRKNSKIHFTPSRVPIKDLNKIAFPAWHLFPVETYLKYAVIGYEKRRSLSIITSRGCPFQCVYCYDTFGKFTRYRSPENVISEMKELKRRYNINYLNFYDETFIAKRERAIAICRGMINAKLNIQWDCNGRVNLVDEELLRIMKKAGCTTIEYGIESGSQEILDRMKKGVKVEQASRAIKLARKVGLNVITPIMIGMPNETKKTINETIRFYRKLGIVSQIFYTTPNPGTPLYDEMKKNGMIKNEDIYMESLEEGYNDIRVNMTRYSDKELRKLKEKAERKILINYILKNWYRIPKIMIERYNNMGLKKFKEHILSYFESYSFRKSGV
jgi:anaerobic magnesium-protoporphyrin IX monomethyl ester cyclase